MDIFVGHDLGTGADRSGHDEITALWPLAKDRGRIALEQCSGTPNSLDERNRTPGVLRSETRMNWFGGPQKLAASNGIQKTCSGDSDTAKTVTRYCAIGFSRAWDINCNESTSLRSGSRCPPANPQ
jgi:hypothetical protein